MLYGADHQLLEKGVTAWEGDPLSVARFDWQQHQSGVEEVESECRKFAISFADRNYPVAPKMGPIGEPDNSFSKMLVGIAVGSALFFVFALPFMGGLVLLGIPAIWMWLSMATGNWTSPELHRQSMEQEFRRKVASWRESKEKFQRDLSRECSLNFWKWVAWFEDVPERLWDEFAAWIRNQSGTLPELRDEIDEWASQPEFPPGPAAVPEGISHEEYEDYCRQVVVSWGYLDAKTSRYVRDGGIDIESEELVIQCKHISGNVRAPEVQAIFGIASSKGKRAVVFSAGGFTKDAISFANEAGVALIRLRERDAQAVPKNSAAEELIGDRTSFTPLPPTNGSNSAPEPGKMSLLERVRGFARENREDEDTGENPPR